MGDVYPKIAGSWVRILRAGAVRRLTMAALLMTGSSALAQENRGTEEQRVACTPDVLRLCSWEIPDVDRIVACLRRERSRLSAGSGLEDRGDRITHGPQQRCRAASCASTSLCAASLAWGLRKKRYARIARHEGPHVRGVA